MTDTAHHHGLLTARGRFALIAVFCPMLIGAADPEHLLQPDPMVLPSYGLSLHPPIGALVETWPTSDVRIRFMGRRNYTMDLLIRRRLEPEDGEGDPIPQIIDPLRERVVDPLDWKIQTGTGELTLARVEEIVVQSMTVADPSAVMIDRRDLATVSGPAIAVYFRLSPTRVHLTPDQKQAHPWVMGLAFTAVQPETFAVLRLQAELTTWDHVRPIFEAVVASLEVEDPTRQVERRHEMILRGDFWHDMLDFTRLTDMLQEDQWFRILKKERDVGFMRIRQRFTRELDMPGIGIEIRSSMAREQSTFVSDSRYFLSEDGTHELWSIRTALEPKALDGRPHAAGQTIAMASWRETGSRSHVDIHVKREGPEGINERRWKKPKKGYISQVMLQLMDGLLPHQKRQSMAFYAYHPNTMRIMLRSIDIMPEPTGSYRVVARPSPDHPEHTTHCSTDGRFIQRELQGGLRIVPATPEEMRKIWNLPGE